MRAEEFVQIYEGAAPERSELLADGLDEQDADAILEIFICPLRRGVSTGSVKDELLRLLTAFDCTKTGISALTFRSPPAPHPRGQLVGFLEADPLVSLSDGSVIMLDHGHPSSPGEICAISGERFLDALAHRVRAGIGAKGCSPAVAASCAMLAGVPPSVALWRTIGE
jgi:hypothetical protein